MPDLSVLGSVPDLRRTLWSIMEQTRIAKVMRKADEQRNVPAHFIRPRYLVWENAPEPLAPQDGEDFRAVIEEIVALIQCLCVPRPDRALDSAGAVIWELKIRLAWRVMDLNSGESPSVAVASSLSQILEAQPHPKYYLSKTACLGILRRAEARGKELPPQLKEALTIQAELA